MSRKRGKWQRERLPANDGRTVPGYRSGPYLVWLDRDVQYGPWAAAHVLPSGLELLLGHARTAKAARALCERDGAEPSKH